MDRPKQPVLGGIDDDRGRRDATDGGVAARPERASDARPAKDVPGGSAPGSAPERAAPRLEKASNAGAVLEAPRAPSPGTLSEHGRLVTVSSRREGDSGGRPIPPPRPAALGAAPEQGRLVTNHLNLFHMLAAGLLLPRSGFSGKYYQDTLDACRGWIPLFTGRPPHSAVDYSTTEARHLRPCHVVVSLKDCAGPAMVATPGGVERRVCPHVGDAALVFVPAPLPVSAIKEIVFRSRGDVTACEEAAKDYANVSLDDFRTRTLRAFAAVRGAASWPPPHAPSERDVPLAAAQAAGGMLAMLRLLANGDPAAILGGQEPLGLAACRAAFNPEADMAPSVSGTAAELAAWMRSGPSTVPPETAAPANPSDSVRLFRGAVDTLAEHAGEAGVNEANARLLDYLDGQAGDLDERLRKHVVELRETLASLGGLADLTASDLFGRFRTPFPRAMSLLFLRNTCEELLDFRHDALGDEDRLAAAVLFGARAGWLTLPLALRAGPAASVAVSHRMSALSHRLAESGFATGPAPPRPKSLAELFAGEWTPRHRGAALELARRQKWAECLETRLKLGAGEYTLKVTSAGTEIVFPGEARAVETRVDRARFSKSLAEAPVDPKHEAAVAEMLPDSPATPLGERRRGEDRRRGATVGLRD